MKIYTRFESSIGTDTEGRNKWKSTAVLLKIQVFWDIIHSSDAVKYVRRVLLFSMNLLPSLSGHKILYYIAVNLRTAQS